MQNKINDLTKQLNKLKGELEFTQNLLREKTTNAKKANSNQKLA